MPGQGTLDSAPGRIVGAIAAVVGVVGFAVFGWRFGDGGGAVPQSLGIVVAAIAVAVVAYRQVVGR